MAEKEPDTEDIIKYLGYNVHPGAIGEFWTSEDEKKHYLQQVKARGGHFSPQEREAALLNTRLMTTADKAISIFGSLLLVISLLMPVYAFDMHGKNISGSAFSYFANLSISGGYASWGGIVMILALLIYSLILITCPVVGVFNIIGLINKNKGEEYLKIVRNNSRYLFVPMLLYVLLFLVLLIGTPQPFGSLGTEALGDTFNLAAIFTMTGIGFWLNIAGLAIIFAQRRGI